MTTYLEVKADVPAAQIATPNSPVPIDYGHVLDAAEAANDVYTNADATPQEKRLAQSVMYLADVVTEIVRGLDHGRLGVYNYPTRD